MNKYKLGAALIVATLAIMRAAPAYAHGFGQRYDLAVPVGYFLAGAAAAVALSFLVIGAVFRRRSASLDYPRYNLLRHRLLRAILASPVLLNLVRIVSVLLFLLVLATSFGGSNKPIENLSPTFVWIIWWVGMAYIAALLGNLWALANPWKIIFDWAERWFTGGSTGREFRMLRYPRRLDVWPALVLFLVFAWLENVYSGAAEPSKLGVLILVYSLITWAGMFVYGKHEWLRHGEAFSVLLGLFARFSPTEVRVSNHRLCRRCTAGCNPTGDECVNCYECFERAGQAEREVNLRPHAIGLVSKRPVTLATGAFVILALSTVTFDGLKATAGWSRFINDVFPAFSAFGGNASGAIDTLGLVLLPVIFVIVFLASSWAIRRYSGETEAVEMVARAFVLSLVPIALAYNIVHFLSLIAIPGQVIVSLASDPFGFGWNLLGTADYRPKLNVINAKYMWFASIGAIVVGHIAAVYLSHIIALDRVGSHARAFRGQIPMVVLMVGYTATSLWIIAQDIVV